MNYFEDEDKEDRESRSSSSSRSLDLDAEVGVSRSCDASVSSGEIKYKFSSHLYINFYQSLENNLSTLH